ncbi:hypothetical protein [Qipengyuania sphaerica]|uniref:hypothetical protein n=1 Tax=Qipengyuania sphaerica TaxID=2867243 RepID=UPI001C88CF32|nr:hypothetical protein [Qipengyuania sphaerica]MBX7541342.1 hypothetical protein [Qipengyuania sphaerica]
MKLRTTIIAMFVLIAICGGALYAMQSYFSRDSQMRDAELAFRDTHADEIAANRAALNRKVPREDEVQPVVEGEEPLTLDDWYADAGSSTEPFDPTPEDNSYLINTAEPFE